MSKFVFDATYAVSAESSEQARLRLMDALDGVEHYDGGDKVKFIYVEGGEENGNIVRAYTLVDQALSLLIETGAEDALGGPMREAIRTTDNAGIAIYRLLALLDEEND